MQNLIVISKIKMKIINNLDEMVRDKAMITNIRNDPKKMQFELTLNLMNQMRGDFVVEL